MCWGEVSDKNYCHGAHYWYRQAGESRFIVPMELKLLILSHACAPTATDPVWLVTWSHLSLTKHLIQHHHQNDSSRCSDCISDYLRTAGFCGPKAAPSCLKGLGIGPLGLAIDSGTVDFVTYAPAWKNHASKYRIEIRK